MRAAPEWAAWASRVIARKSQRFDIADCPRSVQSSRIKVNSALTSCGTGLFLSEEGAKAQAPFSSLSLGL